VKLQNITFSPFNAVRVIPHRTFLERSSEGDELVDQQDMAEEEDDEDDFDDYFNERYGSYDNYPMDYDEGL
jgi:hypothetical protein